MDFHDLGKHIANLRKEKKISQNTICEDLHISRATLSSLENGAGVDIGFKKVSLILDYLGYEISIKQKTPFPVFEDIING